MRLTRSLLVASLLVPLSARIAVAQHVTAGGQGGVDFTRLAGDGSSSGTARPGWLVGGFGRVSLRPNIDVQVEVNVVQTRTRIASIVDDEIRYLQVPILLRWRVAELFSKPIRVVGGGMTAHMLKGREKIGSISDDLKGKVVGSDSAAIIGGEVGVTSRLDAGFRYSYGLQGLYNSFSGLPTGKHHAMQVSASYRLWH